MSALRQLAGAGFRVGRLQNVVDVVGLTVVASRRAAAAAAAGCWLLALKSLQLIHVDCLMCLLAKAGFWIEYKTIGYLE